ncbi:MAG: Na+/H+ antiporter NhaA [Planctomycetes bacterium]|nr:Na+/H+ antiporter NhaA [Planctomycetota bacterium]MBL7038220.1 Na+/H+ antiporter NhaA [Pirellulaceae bacterium]
MENRVEPVPTHQEPIEKILVPFQKFLKAQATGGIILLVCTVVALVWANSPWGDSYTAVWQTKLTVGAGGFTLSKPLLIWINDALMAVFFFVVGLEIKREILVGELASRRQAALPIAAAVGGMVVPATIYAVLNFGSEGTRGWGVPMATDIAFSLGILTLLGSRVPVSAKVFLTALAIVDDIGAAVVIAVFYTDEISVLSLAIGAGFLVAMIVANRIGVRTSLVYAILGAGLWLAFLKSGVHPTIAGVLAAFTIPARVRINAAEFLDRSTAYLVGFRRAGASGQSVLTSKEQRGALEALETACTHAETPLQRLEHKLYPWVTFFIMPVFALANAGVTIDGGAAGSLTNAVAFGIIAGLVIGKQVGITLFSWLAVKAGFAELPSGLTWLHVYGIGWLGGIGFTMSLFVANLAFGDSALLSVAKVGILTASLIAGIGGWVVLSRCKKRPRF